MAEFHEDWFPGNMPRILAKVARSTNHLEGRVVEVGSWEGKSTIALAHAVAPALVHAVDTWKGSPGEISEEIAAHRDVFETFCQNINELTRGNVEAYREDWRDYFAADRSPVRFCFIDATHSYEDVRDNILAVKPLIVPGGIVCGDDRHHVPIVEAVMETLGEDFDEQGTLWIWRVSDE